MSLAEDFAELLPSRQAKAEKDDRPIYYLWTFDPTDGKVYLDHNENKHPADAVTHDELAPHVTHPETVHGFAYSIKGGWRITDDDHTAVEDPFILRRVESAIEKKEPSAPLPSIRYHGRP
jgi:hypothetical protein